MNNYQAIFTDMDGTLLTNQHKISSRTLQAIQAIIKQNIPVILISARPPKAMINYVQQLGCRNGMVFYNGALILDQHLQCIA